MTTGTSESVDKLKHGLSMAITKYRIKKWLLISSVSVIIFCCGVAFDQTMVKPNILTQTEYVPSYIVNEVEVIQEVQVTKEVYPTEFRQFESQEELGKWQAEHYLELQELGKRNNWICVDYALEMQRIAWRDGYLMSIETLIDQGGKTGHMINSTVIGDDIIFLEPQSTTNWVGGVRGDVGVVYRPIQVYPETGEMVYREE